MLILKSLLSLQGQCYLTTVLLQMALQNEQTWYGHSLAGWCCRKMSPSGVNGVGLEASLSGATRTKRCWRLNMCAPHPTLPPPLPHWIKKYTSQGRKLKLPFETTMISASALLECNYEPEDTMYTTQTTALWCLAELHPGGANTKMNFKSKLVISTIESRTEVLADFFKSPCDVIQYINIWPIWDFSRLFFFSTHLPFKYQPIFFFYSFSVYHVDLILFKLYSLLLVQCMNNLCEFAQKT